jgi:glycyl-tRNA synthetase beta chain
MTQTYLLELGTEELPASFLQVAPQALAAAAEKTLTEAGFTGCVVQTFATPRRLALLIEGLSDAQPATTHTVQGPSLKVALDPQGQPTPAGLGFARKMNVPFEALGQQVRGKDTVLVFEQTQEGRPTADVIQAAVPTWVASLTGSHFMRWGHGSLKFSRPLRWLVSLWNEQVLPVTLENVSADRVSYGLRRVGAVSVPHAKDYLATLAEAGEVMADVTARRNLIADQLAKAAHALGGTVVENPELLDTVTLLVEHPSVIAGQFDDAYLSLPRTVLETVMSAHQKYFAVANGQQQLLPVFLTVSNGRKEAAQTIQHGNERVLAARFADARFFFEEDVKTPLENHLPALSGLTFQKGLGTMADKTHRLSVLSEQIAQAAGLSPEDTRHSVRSARLAKADLVTGLVRELTELQGVLGGVYARLQGEAEPVARALETQYQWDAPDDAAAWVLSVADKADTLVAVFAQKGAKLPTGSKDPLGLRRMATGLVHCLMQRPVSLNWVLHTAYQALGPLATQPWETVEALLRPFVQQRLMTVLEEAGEPGDAIEAVLAVEADNLVQVKERLAWLAGLSADTLQAFYEPANRVVRMLGDKAVAGKTVSDVNPDLFQHPSEGALFALMQAQPLSVETAPQYAQQVSAFFDSVLVNDEQVAVRENRYNMLNVLADAYSQYAYFPKLNR